MGRGVMASDPASSGSGSTNVERLVHYREQAAHFRQWTENETNQDDSGRAAQYGPGIRPAGHGIEVRIDVNSGKTGLIEAWPRWLGEEPADYAGLKAMLATTSGADALVASQ